MNIELHRISRNAAARAPLDPVLQLVAHLRQGFVTGGTGHLDGAEICPSMAGLPFILASAHVEYKAPIAKADPVELAMWVSRFGGKSWDFDYEIRHARTKAVFATVRTVQVAYDYKARKTVEIPADVRRKLETLLPG